MFLVFKKPADISAGFVIGGLAALAGVYAYLAK
jgi:hypothetical protein